MIVIMFSAGKAARNRNDMAVILQGSDYRSSPAMSDDNLSAFENGLQVFEIQGFDDREAVNFG